MMAFVSSKTLLHGGILERVKTGRRVSASSSASPRWEETAGESGHCINFLTFSDFSLKGSGCKSTAANFIWTLSLTFCRLARDERNKWKFNIAKAHWFHRFLFSFFFTDRIQPVTLCKKMKAWQQPWVECTLLLIRKRRQSNVQPVSTCTFLYSTRTKLPYKWI